VIATGFLLQHQSSQTYWDDRADEDRRRRRERLRHERSPVYLDRLSEMQKAHDDAHRAAVEEGRRIERAEIAQLEAQCLAKFGYIP
jgi:hypothetical protein